MIAPTKMKKSYNTYKKFHELWNKKDGVNQKKSGYAGYKTSKYPLFFYMPIFFKIRKREKLKIQIVDNFSVYNLVIIFLFF